MDINFHGDFNFESSSFRSDVHVLIRIRHCSIYHLLLHNYDLHSPQLQIHLRCFVREDAISNAKQLLGVSIKENQGEDTSNMNL